jgi:hypothetical protein
MEVEREVADVYRALVHEGAHRGEVYEGDGDRVRGERGCSSTLDSPFVDVLVRMEALGQRQLRGSTTPKLRASAMRSGERISLGDPMMVLIEDVSLIRRTVYGRRVNAPEDEPEVGRKRRAVKRSAATVTDRPGPPKRKPSKAAVKGKTGKKGGKKKR